MALGTFHVERTTINKLRKFPCMIHSIFYPNIKMMYQLAVSLFRLSIFSAWAVLSVVPILADDDDDDDDDRFVANEIVIKLDPASGATIEDIHAQYGTTTLSTVLESAAIYLVGVADGSDVENLSEVFEDDPRLLYAEPNYVTSVPQSDGHVIWAWSGGVPELGVYPEEILGQSSTELLDLPAVRAISTGQGIIVAIIDTGVDIEHPNLINNLVSGGYDFVEDNAVPQDNRMNLDADGDGLFDENFGHGTHVAGVVLLAAPEAQILPMRVLDSEGRGNVFTLVEAINRAVAAGADIINLSLGIDFYSDLLEDTIEDAVEQNVLVVAAAGNANSDLPRYPAADEDVLGVASVDANDVKSAFTNWGPWIGVSAPGEALISAFPENAYSAWSGTSMAAPLVAGQAAVLKAISPNIHEQALLQLITSTAFNIDSVNPAWTNQLGSGRIDLLASANAMLGGATGTDLGGAIDRLEAGWEEAYVVTEGTVLERIDDEEYGFLTGGIEVILKLWDDDLELVVGSAIRVTGELELANDDELEDRYLFELDAEVITRVDGSPLDGGTDSSGSSDTIESGTLAQLVDLLESRGAEEISVQVDGVLGASAFKEADDDDDYLFTDGSGVTVVLDLDSRARLDFSFTQGIALQIVGELSRLETDESDTSGVQYELDALWVELPGSISFDVGQLTPFADATISDWFGYSWETDVAGWFYDASKGFVFAGDTFGDDDWFFSSNLSDWIYASRAFYPFIYSNAEGWHYLIGSAFDPTQHAYNYERNKWVMDFWK